MSTSTLSETAFVDSTLIYVDLCAISYGSVSFTRCSTAQEGKKVGIQNQENTTLANGILGVRCWFALCQVGSKSEMNT